jgi:hypothetical protein
MIDAVVECGGRYYLPYRLHATKEQLVKAYPRAPEFFERKRHYDPHGLFQNQFYIKYGPVISRNAPIKVTSVDSRGNSAKIQNMVCRQV